LIDKMHTLYPTQSHAINKAFVKYGLLPESDKRKPHRKGFLKTSNSQVP